MRKLIIAALAAASLGGCVTRDYCADSHPVHLRQSKPEWEVNYRTCRMMEAVINQPAPRMAVDVYIRN